MNEKELLKELKRIEEVERLQERIIEKKKAHVEKLSLKGNSETIAKAKAQEDKAITVLERIREDKRRVEAEFNKQPKIANEIRIESELENVTKEVEDEWDSKDKGQVEVESNKNSNGLEMQAKKVSSIKDILKTWAEMEMIKNLISFLLPTPKENKEKRRLEEIEIENKEKRRLEEIEIENKEWEKKRNGVLRRWSEIGEKNPVLTLEELREVYIMHYPEDDKELERYLEEREEGAKTKDGSQHTGKIIRYEKKYNGNACVLCLLLCIGIIPGLLYYLLARETIPIYEGDNK